VASAAHHWLPDIGVDHFQYDDPLGGSRVLVRGVRAIANPAEDPERGRLAGVRLENTASDRCRLSGKSRRMSCRFPRRAFDV
jgi:hypothetical protein